MICRRASEIDLLGYLDEPRRPEFAEFRTHYPRCRECAAEVRAWSELRGALRAGGAAAAHPEPQALALYEEAPGRLAPSERRSLEAHLASCAACRDELRALRAFPPAPQAGRAPTPAPGAARGRSWLASLRRLLWNPALAYALLAAFVAPTLYLQVAGRSPAVERAEPPTATALAGASRIPEPPAPAREQAAPADASELRATAPAAGAEAGSSLAMGRDASGQAPPRSTPEPRRYAELPRAASRPRVLAERMQSEQEFAVTSPDAPALGGARALAPGAGRDLMPREVAPPAADEVAMARQESRQQAAEATAAAVAELAAPALVLREGEIPKLSAASARAGLRLSVTVPEPGTGETESEKGIPKLSAAAPRAGEIEVRLVAPGGARELRERHRSERSATIDVPPGWLAPGRYQVALQRLGAGLVMDEAHFAFDVEPETGPER